MATPPHPNTRFCAYIKVDGHRCGSPAWQDFDHCWHHHGLKQRFEEKKVSIPPLDDQNSVQVAIMDILNGLLSGRLDRANAYTLLYGIQIARHNLKGLTLVPPSPDVVAEQIAAARAEAKAEAIREQGDFDENGEPISLAALLLKELRESPRVDDETKAEPPLEREWWTTKKA